MRMIGNNRKKIISKIYHDIQHVVLTSGGKPSSILLYEQSTAYPGATAAAYIDHGFGEEPQNKLWACNLGITITGKPTVIVKPTITYEKLVHRYGFPNSANEIIFFIELKLKPYFELREYFPNAIFYLGNTIEDTIDRQDLTDKYYKVHNPYLNRFSIDILKQYNDFPFNPLSYNTCRSGVSFFGSHEYNNNLHTDIKTFFPITYRRILQLQNNCSHINNQWGGMDHVHKINPKINNQEFKNVKIWM